MVDGLHEADAPHLEQVVQVLAPVREPLHHAEDQPQVAVDELAAGCRVPVFHPFQQSDLLPFLENRQPGGVDPADFHLVHHAFIPLSEFFLTGVWADLEKISRGPEFLPLKKPPIRGLFVIPVQTRRYKAGNICLSFQ